VRTARAAWGAAEKQPRIELAATAPAATATRDHRRIETHAAFPSPFSPVE